MSQGLSFYIKVPFEFFMKQGSSLYIEARFELPILREKQKSIIRDDRKFDPPPQMRMCSSIVKDALQKLNRILTHRK